ncbi:class I SAM-dependent methyltransferase [Fructilactobacillus myrtifloralis]|uniref:Class I SAM-dependent methyltransferase n=1 Tax=Fructilactobacillus myrtifloralis TaxID=2940301 RepID=A0ABY5BQC3_9LACO|nr:class I SAM-dependent methyltransferase [Fructilactobacillus myrtifloralis]USS85253.1 class I SAM-dependent methyltransferase [Fructilactobacillus myrtifloralis]
MIYSQFATFYDQLFDNELYPQWADYVKRWVQPPARVLDLACGTGRLLVLLDQAGYQVTGVDLSADMLALANQHLAEAETTVPLLQLNMLDLQELGEFDAVTCFDDSLCYLQDLSEVTQVFQTVADRLPVGGQFLFDVITPYQTDVKYPGYMYNYQDDDQAFMWTTYAGSEPHAVEHDLTFFHYQPELDAYAAYAETHYERTYPLGDYEQALHSAGFGEIIVTSDFGKAPVTDTTTRWFFRGVKQ